MDLLSKDLSDLALVDQLSGGRVDLTYGRQVVVRDICSLMTQHRLIVHWIYSAVRRSNLMTWSSVTPFDKKETSPLVYIDDAIGNDTNNLFTCCTDTSLKKFFFHHDQYSKELSMILVKCSFPSEPYTSPMPGAKSSTRLWGKVPSTNISMSLLLYL